MKPRSRISCAGLKGADDFAHPRFEFGDRECLLQTVLNGERRIPLRETYRLRPFFDRVARLLPERRLLPGLAGRAFAVRFARACVDDCRVFLGAFVLAALRALFFAGAGRAGLSAGRSSGWSGSSADSTYDHSGTVPWRLTLGSASSSAASAATAG
jgi:hypothetical protein